MRNFGFMFLALALILALAPAASAQPTGLYFTPKVGFAVMKAGIDANADLEGYGPWKITEGTGYKGKVILGLAAGYDFKPIYDVPLRAEFEYAWRDKIKENWAYNGVSEKVEVGAQHSFFINVYFDIYNSSPVTPYVGAGLGLASVSGKYMVTYGGDTIDVKKSKTNFAWNIGAGAAWKISDNVALDLGYRYADFGKVSASGETQLFGLDLLFDGKFDVAAHEVMLGLRYTF